MKSIDIGLSFGSVIIMKRQDLEKKKTKQKEHCTCFMTRKKKKNEEKKGKTEYFIRDTIIYVVALENRRSRWDRILNKEKDYTGI